MGIIHLSGNKVASANESKTGFWLDCLASKYSLFLLQSSCVCVASTGQIDRKTAKKLSLIFRLTWRYSRPGTKHLHYSNGFDEFIRGFHSVFCHPSYLPSWEMNIRICSHSIAPLWPHLRRRSLHAADELLITFYTF